MRIVTAIVALAMAAAWVTLFTVSAHAVSQMGSNAAGAVFFGDFAHPWRAQFNTDFSIHLMLAAAWMIWRSRSWPVGVACGVLTICLGAVFLLPYLALAWWRGGSLAAALLGCRAVPDAKGAH